MNQKPIEFTVILLGIIGMFAASVSGVNNRTIAVLYFENNSLSQKTEMEPLRKGLADMFITELAKIEQLQVIERAQLQKLLDELALGQSGVVEQTSAQQVGKLLGAQNLLLGSYMQMLDGKMRIDVRIVEVETGRTVKAEEETGKPQDLHQLLQKLVAKVAKDLEIKISSADAQRLQVVENTSFEAAMYFAKGLEYQDAHDTQNAIKMYQKALKANPEFRKAKVQLKALLTSK